VIAALLALLLAAPDTTGIMRLVGRASIAHACPIGVEGRVVVVTSAHVIQLDRYEPLIPYRYSDGADGEGIVFPVYVDLASDLAVMRPLRMPTRWYPAAASPPKPGDRVRFLGYDRDTRKSAYLPREFDRSVVRVVAGHLILDTPGEAGSSGSCVLNQAGEVVAVNARGEQTKAGEPIGSVVGVWGRWLTELLADEGR
jgi:hypothetical protein